MSAELSNQAVLDLLRRNAEAIQALQAKIEEVTPKVEFYDTVTQSEDTKDFAEVAKILNVPGMGRNNLMAVLRDMRVLRGDNTPYQSFVDRGYFKVVEVEKSDSYGTARVYTKTVVYQKGIDFIRKLITEQEGES